MSAGAACLMFTRTGWPKRLGQLDKRILNVHLPSGYAEGLHRPPLTGWKGQHVAELPSGMLAMRSLDVQGSLEEGLSVGPGGPVIRACCMSRAAEGLLPRLHPETAGCGGPNRIQRLLAQGGPSRIQRLLAQGGPNRLTVFDRGLACLLGPGRKQDRAAQQQGHHARVCCPGAEEGMGSGCAAVLQRLEQCCFSKTPGSPCAADPV